MNQEALLLQGRGGSHKKLKPFLVFHRSILEKFMINLWDFYDLLRI
jgi:hypothetical protein